MKISYIKVAIFMVLAVLISSCGSTLSAPPVELPAPITGRIDISEPDADGNVTITGSAGAVTANSMVMAVNEAVAGTVAWKVLDLFVSTAHAETSFPAICSEAGHACAVADSEGAFVILLAASTGDSIVIGIIDSTSGEFISGIIRRLAGDGSGENTEEDVNCAGQGVSGETVDVAVVPFVGLPILLKQGSETTTNQLEIGYPTPVTVDIDGCYAHSIAIAVSINDTVVQYGTAVEGNITVVVTSKDDRIIWHADLEGAQITNATSFTISDYPMHVVFGESPNEPIVALDKGNSVAIGKVDLINQNVNSEITITYPGTNDTAVLAASTAMDMLRMYDSADSNLGLLLTYGSDLSDSYLTLFNADAMKVLATWSTSEFMLYQPTDAKFFVDNELLVYVIGVDASSPSLVINSVTYNSTNDPLDISTNIDSPNIISWSLVTNHVASAQVVGSGSSIPIRKIAFSEKVPEDVTTNSTRYVAAVSNDGYLWLWPFDYSVYFGTATQLAAGHDLVAISSDQSSKKAFVADKTGNSTLAATDYLW